MRQSRRERRQTPGEAVIETDRHQIDQPLAPILGVRGFGMLMLKQREYLELVDHTGRQIHPGKRGAVPGPPPAALARIGYTADPWQRQVLAVGSGYFRAIGFADVLIEKAREIEPAWLRGIGVARQLKRLAARGAGKESWCTFPGVAGTC